MSKLSAATVIAQVRAWHGITLSEPEAAAIAAEASAYGSVTGALSRELLFEDQPSDLVHALEGRRRWRGPAR